MDWVRRARLYFGCMGEFLFPVVGDDSVPVRDSSVWRGVLLARRAASSGDLVAASALHRQLLMEGTAEAADDEALVVSRIDAGVLDWWSGDVAAAREHFAEAVATCDPLLVPLLHRALLNLACCEEDGEEDAEVLLTGPLASDAAVARAVFRARAGRLGDSLRILDAIGHPSVLGTLNEAAVRVEAGDPAGALALYAAVLEDLPPGPDHHRAAALVGWGNALTLSAAGMSGAERAAALMEAERHLVSGSELLRSWTGPHRLVADCLRNLGVLHLLRAADAEDRELLSLALRNHWAALEHYHQAPWAAPGRIGDQWRNLALCYDLTARMTPADARWATERAAECRARAVAALGAVGDYAALAEADLTEASLRLDGEPEEALRLALPAALFRSAQRFGFAGVQARNDWADAEASHAIDLALRAAERAERSDVASALVVTMRFGGITDWGMKGATFAIENDATVQSPPPRIDGVTASLSAFIEEACVRYRLAPGDLVNSAMIDLMGAPGR